MRKRSTTHLRHLRSVEASPRLAWGPKQLLVLVLGFSIGAFIALGAIHWGTSASRAAAASFSCDAPEVIDGDTLRCGSESVRLHGIDAPELPGHCRPGRRCVEGDPFASTENLRRLIDGSTLQCSANETDRYGRTVARCSANGVDLSCAQLASGHAERRYGFIWCGW